MNVKKFYDSSGDYKVNLKAKATLSADRTIELPDAAGTLSLVTGTETLTNKTLTSPTLTTPTLTSPTITTPTIDGVVHSGLNDRELICEVVAVGGAALQAANLTLWTAPAASIILRVLLDITTGSTGASTINIGYTTTSATQASDTLLDGIDGAVIALSDSMNAALDSGANALAQKAASGKWITAQAASGNTTGLVANAYIFYVKI